MRKRGNALLAALGSAGLACAAGLPSVTLTSVEQKADRTIVVSYRTEHAPAVVTWEVWTNGAPVAARTRWTATGAVNVLVAEGNHVFSWRPDDVTDDRAATFSAADAEMRLTAWPTNNPPDYMVVDLCRVSATRVRYFPDAASLPGGLLANPLYRTSSLVMRRIHAENLPWSMGGTGVGAHAVTLDHDYYLGVFELTRAQHAMILADQATPRIFYRVEADVRPSDCLTYNLLRGTTGTSSSAPETDTPDPTAASVLGQLRALTGIAFDLPTEAEWEFAATAHAPQSCWPDGARIDIADDRDANVPGRYRSNGGMKSDTAIYMGEEVGPTNATAVVGSYAPNRFGLYDMAGNVEEWCRDWYRADISELGGACVEVQQTTGAATDYCRVLRGGGIRTGATACLPNTRAALPPNGCIDNMGNFVGYRPYAPCCAK